MARQKDSAQLAKTLGNVRSAGLLCPEISFPFEDAF